MSAKVSDNNMKNNFKNGCFYFRKEFGFYLADVDNDVWIFISGKNSSYKDNCSGSTEFSINSFTDKEMEYVSDTLGGLVKFINDSINTPPPSDATSWVRENIK